MLVHNKWFNTLDLGAALVLLSLGYIEGNEHVPVQVHGSIELCALILIAGIYRIIPKIIWSYLKIYIFEILNFLKKNGSSFAWVKDIKM